MKKEPSGRFEVTDHREISGRGGFVIGHIREGTVTVGDSVPLPNSSTCWAVSGVEFVDNISERKFWNAIVFKEQPKIADVKATFPIGCNVDVYRPHDS